MLKTIILAENPLDSSTWETHNVDDIIDFLKTKFDTFPETARIYHNQVAENCDVTPFDEKSFDKLKALDGTFYVVVYPAAEYAGIIYAIVTIIIAAVSYYQSQSQIPSASTRTIQNESPNNELSERTNRARPKARIPDIYGTVRSTPDLLSLPYSVYEEHLEVEFAYMCVGRGSYDIPVNEIKDETTPISEIEGSSIEVYAPNTSPNSGDAPQVSIGNPIDEPLYIADRSNTVNGQVLKASDKDIFIADNNVRARSSLDETTFVIEHDPLENINFNDYYTVGQTIELINFVYTDGFTAVNLDGIYTINAIDAFGLSIGLADADIINPDWLELDNYPDNATGYVSPILEPTDSVWVGPFVISSPDLEKVFSNFIALNGLYVDTGSGQNKIDVEVQVGLRPIDSTGAPTDEESFYNATIEGSATVRSTRAITLKMDFGTTTPNYVGYFQIRARRITGTHTGGNVVDEVKWRDIYAMAKVYENDFGDVTTVHSVTQATAGALVVKNRKLNMLATRKIPQRISGSDFTTDLFPTNRADEIISAICLDPKIGNRSKEEIDFDNIYDTVAEIETYFGSEKAVEFNYTFDADNLSFEEIMAQLANAIFSTAYRLGNVIKLNFEKETENSLLLFNHRNKLPGSETRTIRFGNQNNHDGVELEYVSDIDDAIVTINLPDDLARNPKKIETIGIRNRIQAYWLAWRLWNKIQFQNIACEFDATQEADLLVINDRVLVADNTRPGTQDGDVISQNGLELELSQPITFELGDTYTIFLQHTDATTESIAVSAGSDEYHVLLATPPKTPLYLEDTGFARATFQIVANSSERETAFLVTEKQTLSNLTSKMTTINYSDKYYQNDKDFENGIIDEDGNEI
jgi:hypothetical protein